MVSDKDGISSPFESLASQSNGASPNLLDDSAGWHPIVHPEQARKVKLEDTEEMQHTEVLLEGANDSIDRSRSVLTTPAQDPSSELLLEVAEEQLSMSTKASLMFPDRGSIDNAADGPRGTELTQNETDLGLEHLSPVMARSIQTSQPGEERANIRTLESSRNLSTGSATGKASPSETADRASEADQSVNLSVNSFDRGPGDEESSVNIAHVNQPGLSSNESTDQAVAPDDRDRSSVRGHEPSFDRDASRDERPIDSASDVVFDTRSVLDHGDLHENSMLDDGGDVHDTPSGTKWQRENLQRSWHQKLLSRGSHAPTSREKSLSALKSLHRPDTLDFDQDTTIPVVRPEVDQFPDISYEHSFMPPHDHESDEGYIGYHNTGQNQKSEPVNSQDSLGPSTDAIHKPKSENANQEDSNHNVLGKPDLPSDTQATEAFLSPLPSNPRAWETPAATKQYMKEVPTRTAIARRVESFQIPPERLAALQPEIAALQDQSKRPAEKLSLKESSAQIDALLNENWGLKMKIMFMDKHFEHDREKAELIAENVRLQTNGFNFVQQVKARDKTIKALERQIEQSEFQNAKLEAEKNSSSSLDTLEKIHELEHYINILEHEHDKVVHELEVNLDDASSRLQEAERQAYDQETLRSSDQTYLANDIAIFEDMKESLAEAEQEIEDLEIELQVQVDNLEKALSAKDQQLLDYQHRTLEVTEQLRLYEKELSESDKLRQDTIHELRNIHENERLEYETYIEDRHEEIDNLKRAINSYNQDSFDLRLAEALRSQEQAWKENNQQCEDLRAELNRRSAAFDDELEYFEKELARLESNASKLLKENSALKSQLSTRESEVHRLNTAQAELLKETQRLKEQLAGQEPLPAGTSASPTRLSSPKPTMPTEETFQDLRESNQALSIEIRSRQELLTQLRQDLEDTTQELSELKLQSKDDVQELEHLDQLCQSYQDELASLRADLDNKTQKLDHLTKQLNVQADEGKERIKLESQVDEKQRQLTATEAKLTEALSELQSVQLIFEAHSSPESSAKMSLGEHLSRYLESVEDERASLQKNVASLTQLQENVTIEIRRYQRTAEQSQAMVKSLERKSEVSQKAASELRVRNDSMEADLSQLQKRLATVQKEADHLGRDSAESQRGNTEALVKVFENLQLLTGVHPAQNVATQQTAAALTKAIDQLVLQLSEQLKSATPPRAQEQIANLEAQLAVKSRSEEKTKSMLTDLKKDLDQLRRQKAEATERLSTAANSQPTAADRASQSSRASSRHDGKKGPYEDYWVLHERIRVLTDEVKYQKELREQDDKAAKSRLAESKREKKELMDTVRRLRVPEKPSLAIEGSETLSTRSDFSA